MLEQLYRQYGELLIQAEILNNKIVEVKKQVAQALNNQQLAPKVQEAPKEEKKEEKK